MYLSWPIEWKYLDQIFPLTPPPQYNMYYDIHQLVWYNNILKWDRLQAYVYTVHLVLIPMYTSNFFSSCRHMCSSCLNLWCWRSIMLPQQSLRLLDCCWLRESKYTTTRYHYINMIVVCPLWKVSGNDLTSKHKGLYLWLLTKRSYN